MSSRALSIAIVVTAALAIVGAGSDAPWSALFYLGKPATTALIFLLAWFSSSLSSSPTLDARYRRAVLVGIVLSLVGDVFLMWPNQGFVPGLIAFLLAHIGYIVAFAPGSSARARGAIGVVMLCVAAANLVGLLPRIGAELKGPVLAYVAVLTTMATFAIARAWTPALARETPRSVRFAAVGGAAFVLSDSLLAWDKFGGAVPQAQLLILSTYWFAQWCIARSVRAA